MPMDLLNVRGEASRPVASLDFDQLAAVARLASALTPNAARIDRVERGRLA
jgi:hypothetical protein